jgi:hypothetical protein
MSLERYISLRTALGEMVTTNEPFSIEFVTCNVSKKTGGKRVLIDRAWRCAQQQKHKDNDMIQIAPKNANDHVYDVYIHLIRRFNNRIITF